MNLRNSLIALLIFASLAACDELKETLDKLLTFSIDHSTAFTIESASPLNLPFEFSTPDVTTNSSQEFENNGTKAELVKDVRLKKLALTITQPTTKTFSFLKSIHIYISTNSNDEIELAFKDNIASDAKTIDLTCTEEKLDTYIKASSYKLRMKVVTKETLSQDVDVQADLTFEVKAESL